MSVMRGVLTFFSTVFSILLACVLLLVILLATEFGLNVAIGVADLFLPGQLTIKEVNGRLLGPIKLKNIHYVITDKHDKNKTTDLFVSELNIHWKPSHLWEGDLLLDSLQVKSLMLSQQDSDAPTLEGTHDLAIDDVMITGHIQDLFSQASYEVVVNWSGLDIALLRQGASLKDRGMITIKGDMQGGQAVLEGAIDHLPIEGKVTVNREDSKVLIPVGYLQFGHAKFTMTGELDGHWDMHWSLIIPKLHEFFIEAVGEVRGEGTIVGDINQSQIKGDMAFRNMDINGLYIKKADIALDVNTDLSAVSSLSIDVQDLGKDESHLIEWHVGVKGTLPQHEMVSKIKSELFQSELRISGSWKQKQWLGTITQLTLSSDDFHKWSMQKPSQLMIDQHSLSLTPLCLKANEHSVCLELALPTARHGFLFDPDQSIRGALDINVDNIADFPIPENKWVKNPKGQFIANLKLGGVLSEPVLLGQAKFENGQFEFPKAGIVAKNMTVSIESPRGKRIKLVGKTNTGKGWLNIQGDFSADLLTLEGTLKIEGDQVLVADNPEFYILLSPRLLLAFSKERLNITGTIDIPKAKITPEDFTSVDELTKDAVVVVDKQGVSLDKMDEDQLPVYTNITVSFGKDIYFAYSGIKGKLLGDLTVSDEPKGPTTANGKIILDKGQYKAYGQFLKIDRGWLLYAGGSISNPNLDIRASRTVRGMGPAEEVKVGVDVRGSLHTPRVSLFSEPSDLSQGDILSYLVIGRSMQQSTGGEQQTLASSASALNLGFFGAKQVNSDLEQSLGLDVVSVGTIPVEDSSAAAATGQQTAIILGKYLSPRLYVGYAVGLIDQVSVFNMRYQIAKKWFVQTESSIIGNAVDLFYTFERD